MKKYMDILARLPSLQASNQTPIPVFAIVLLSLYTGYNTRTFTPFPLICVSFKRLVTSCPIARSTAT